MNLGFSEMIFIFFLALLFFGPRKLPEIARQIGRLMAEVKRASNQFQMQIEDEVRKLEIEERALKAKEDHAKPEVIPPAAPEENSIKPPAAPVIVPPNGATASAASMHPEAAGPETVVKQEQQA